MRQSPFYVVYYQVCVLLSFLLIGRVALANQSDDENVNPAVQDAAGGGWEEGLRWRLIRWGSRSPFLQAILYFALVLVGILTIIILCQTSPEESSDTTAEADVGTTAERQPLADHEHDNMAKTTDSFSRDDNVV